MMWWFLLACAAPKTDDSVASVDSEAPEPPAPFYVVSNAPTGAMRTYDLDGQHLSDLVPPNGFLPGSSQIDLAPDGKTLLVATYNHQEVWRVDIETGADLGPLPGDNPLTGPSIFSTRADGALLVSDFLGGAVYAYDLDAEAWLGMAFEDGHLTNPHEVVQIGEEYLVADYGEGSITRFDAEGDFVEVMADGPELRGPLGMLLTPDGRLLVCNNANSSVVAFDPISGAPLGTLIQGDGLRYPEGLELTPEGDLLVASARNTTIFRVDIDTGAVLGEFEHLDDDEGTVDVLLVAPG